MRVRPRIALFAGALGLTVTAAVAVTPFAADAAGSPVARHDRRAAAPSWSHSPTDRPAAAPPTPLPSPTAAWCPSAGQFPPDARTGAIVQRTARTPRLGREHGELVSAALRIVDRRVPDPVRRRYAVGDRRCPMRLRSRGAPPVRRGRRQPGRARPDRRDAARPRDDRRHLLEERVERRDHRPDRRRPRSRTTTPRSPRPTAGWVATSSPSSKKQRRSSRGSTRSEGLTSWSCSSPMPAPAAVSSAKDRSGRASPVVAR